VNEDFRDFLAALIATGARFAFHPDGSTS